MKKQFILFALFISVLNFSQNLKKEILKITKDKNATVAVSVKGIDFPYEFNNENADKKLPMLSVFKFHIAAAVLNEVDHGKLKLDQKIPLKKSDLLENTHSPLRDKYPNANVELTVDEIIKYTVAQSDNNGCDILLRLIGGTQTVQKFMDSKGIKKFQIKYNEEWMHKGKEYLYPNYTTVKSLSLLYKSFFEKKILSEKSTAYLMNIMLGTTTGANKLKEQLPAGTAIAHKTGSSGKDGNLTIAENDSGIITLPDGKHYAITVFVIDSTESEAVNTKMISDISKKVWDYFNSTHKNK
ncbi:class A beta-lactamase, subclass A2 [Kaistella sp. DKR-2]|uniref:class A beta-lactamase, subclass A2 n=1 Tax=Kaistella soli TaxID=2849654 RepID=UPI001C251499|nr:class A beta-lactamase, subclass A2 [Kaistella soli]MBU8882497.1 class A beta-lactamase, subclass A2 [Kaistella soli]